MKKAVQCLTLVAICVFLIIGLTGCTNTTKPPEPSEPVVQPGDGNDGQLQPEIVPGNVLTDDYPAEIQKYLEANEQQETQQALNINNHTYIVMTMGEQRSGGYSIKLDKIELKDATVMVYADYIKPGQDEGVTMALTYPHLVIETDKIYEGHYLIDYQIRK